MLDLDPEYSISNVDVEITEILWDTSLFELLQLRAANSQDLSKSPPPSLEVDYNDYGSSLTQIQSYTMTK